MKLPVGGAGMTSHRVLNAIIPSVFFFFFFLSLSLIHLGPSNLSLLLFSQAESWHPGAYTPRALYWMQSTHFGVHLRTRIASKRNPRNSNEQQELNFFLFRTSGACAHNARWVDLYFDECKGNAIEIKDSSNPSYEFYTYFAPILHFIYML